MDVVFKSGVAVFYKMLLFCFVLFDLARKNVAMKYRKPLQENQMVFPIFIF